jgi:hypothetical protein
VKFLGRVIDIFIQKRIIDRSETTLGRCGMPYAEAAVVEASASSLLTT